eukprot:SAG31_NODE_1265_length_9070_cov_5.167205_5_plen_64_part_00
MRRAAVACGGLVHREHVLYNAYARGTRHNTRRRGIIIGPGVTRTLLPGWLRSRDATLHQLPYH